MKVIVAGFPKTGTKSMNTALTILGYNVYDYMENVYILRQDYKKILRDGSTKEDWKRMYEDVDAIVDFPAFHFWEEIHKAFPDAKIVLTLRDDEDVWVKSFKNQIKVNGSNITMKVLAFLSPTERRARRDVVCPAGSAIAGLCYKSFWKIVISDEMLKMKYRSHNANVIHNAPTDKLLIFRCSEGWKPLCKFLGVPIPDRPFPHKNVGGDILEELLEVHPVFVGLQREMYVSIIILITAFTVGGYVTYRVGPRNIYNSLIRGAGNLLKKMSLGN